MYNNRMGGKPASTVWQSLLPYLNFNMMGKYCDSYCGKNHTELNQSQGRKKDFDLLAKDSSATYK